MLDSSDYLVIIISKNQYDEREWKRIVRAGTAKGARCKATNWIRRYICKSDYTKIEKHRHDCDGFDHWYLKSD